jgi:hypothetical protein
MAKPSASLIDNLRTYGLGDLHLMCPGCGQSDQTIYLLGNNSWLCVRPGCESYFSLEDSLAEQAEDW